MFRPKETPNSNYKVSIRSSEIYLIAAEAAAHVDGKLDQAKDRLKELIKVRLQPDYYEERAAEIDQMTAEELLVRDCETKELANISSLKGDIVGLICVVRIVRK